MKKQITKSLICATLLTVTTFGASANDFIKGSGTVFRVIDGDTIDVNVHNKSVYNTLKRESTKDGLKYFKDRYKNFRIRIANINTAESKHRKAYKNTKAGEYSSQYLKKLIEKKNVNFTCWTQGDYDRYICSVSYKGNDIGIHMIENDHSKYITYFGKHPYMHNAYKRAQ